MRNATEALANVTVPLWHGLQLANTLSPATEAAAATATHATLWLQQLTFPVPVSKLQQLQAVAKAASHAKASAQRSFNATASA